MVARDVVADGRTYWIYYHDPWRPHRGSFLQSGKNVAGVEARSVPDRPGLWVITHEELMRVLDSVITTAPTEEAEAAPET